jgi:hypothetical protein
MQPFIHYFSQTLTTLEVWANYVNDDIRRHINDIVRNRIQRDYPDESSEDEC